MKDEVDVYVVMKAHKGRRRGVCAGWGVPLRSHFLEHKSYTYIEGDDDDTNGLMSYGLDGGGAQCRRSN